mmetsp:Transcript_1300/g.5775  ORF Transcript_1300/g.5775 Transcript_1300/m.5775 type:complete len:225 (-) Transcript_1300:95-769(-)
MKNRRVLCHVTYSLAPRVYVWHVVQHGRVRLLQFLQLVVHVQDLLAVDLQHQPAHDGLVQHRVRLGRVEDEVQLAHVLEHAVQGLDVHLYQVHHRQLGLAPVAQDAEVQRREVAVHQLGVGPESLLVIYERAQVVGARGDDLVHRLAQLRLLLRGQLLVEPAQPNHGVVVHHEERLDHGASLVPSLTLPRPRKLFPKCADNWHASASSSSWGAGFRVDGRRADH